MLFQVVNHKRYVLQSGSGDFNAPTIQLIKLLLIMYVYDTHQSNFIQLPDMPASLPVQIYNARKALQLIDQGAVGNCCFLPMWSCIYVWHVISAWHRFYIEAQTMDTLSGREHSLHFSRNGCSECWRLAGASKSQINWLGLFCEQIGQKCTVREWPNLFITWVTSNGGYQVLCLAFKVTEHSITSPHKPISPV